MWIYIYIYISCLITFVQFWQALLGNPYIPNTQAQAITLKLIGFPRFQNLGRCLREVYIHALHCSAHLSTLPALFSQGQVPSDESGSALYKSIYNLERIQVPGQDTLRGGQIYV